MSGEPLKLFYNTKTLKVICNTDESGISIFSIERSQNLSCDWFSTARGGLLSLHGNNISVSSLYQWESVSLC